MSAETSASNSVSAFLRAQPARVQEWLTQQPTGFAAFCLGAIVMGAGSYGAVMGCWRDLLQALYVAIKLPLVILLTTLGNALLNGMLAPLMGFNATFRQSFTIVLMTFATASIILGALSPVALFVVWNTPPLTATTQLISPEYNFMQLMIAVFIGCAGFVGNAHAAPLLLQWTRNAAVARNVVLTWLASNLFLGSQICWVLRPFIWDPAGSTRFIGREYFHGSFYETIFEAVRRLMFP